jgi:hypothetical protein
MRWGLAAALVAVALVGGKTLAQDNHPDFSGVWTAYHEPGAKPGAFRPGMGPPLPLTPEGQKQVAAYHALVDPSADGPGAHCLGTGMPGSMLSSGGYPMEIVQTPNEIVVIYEAHTEVRHIYLGDRIVPEADRIEDRNGTSAAHWEGDTLVVETDNLRPQVDQRYAHSDQATIVERYHLTTDAAGAKVLEADMTMTDPTFYTQPVTSQKKWAFVPGGHILPYQCDEQVWLDHLDALKSGKPDKGY